MKNGSYFIEREKLNAFMKGAGHKIDFDGAVAGRPMVGAGRRQATGCRILHQFQLGSRDACTGEIRGKGV